MIIHTKRGTRLVFAIEKKYLYQNDEKQCGERKGHLMIQNIPHYLSNQTWWRQCYRMGRYDLPVKLAQCIIFLFPELLA